MARTIVVLLTALLTLGATLIEAGFRDSSPLFKDSSHVKTLTNDNYGDMLDKTDEVWIVDFYAPWCPHCRDFAPELEKIAAFYSKSKTINVGAVDCTTNAKVCNKEEVMGYPTIKLFHVPPTSSKGKKYTQFGSKTMKTVVKWVEDLLEEAKMTAGIQNDDVDQQVALIQNEQVVEDSGLPLEHSMKMRYARLQDAGSAAIFTLENSLFIGKTTLEGERYQAAVRWIDSLAATFPLEQNRAAFRDLAEAVRQRDRWEDSAWKSLLDKWKALAKESTFPKTLLVYDEEATWAHCNTYTCGLWTLFHSMSVGAGSSSCPLKPSEVASAIRLFVMHFFGCEQCVKHFLRANPETVIVELGNHDSAGNSALVMWLWRMHNKVNKVTKKQFWPMPKTCPQCFTEGVKTPTLDPATLHESEIVAFMHSVYEQKDTDVWTMNYQNNGVGAVLSDSFSGFSSLVLVVVMLVVVFANTQKDKIGAVTYALLKREHAA